MPDLGGKYWDSIAGEQTGRNRQGIWRRYCDMLHTRLLDRWLGPLRFESALKTDLFDEAVGPGLVAALSSRAARVAGIDVSQEIAGAAARRNPGLRACRADVRQLPFADGEFDLVLSDSTLDHFESRVLLRNSLHELARVLRAGGRLVLTLDNPGNPAVWLRNRLPIAWLKRSGIVPYYVGATAGHKWLGSALSSEGFEILESTAIMHCPRVLAVAAASRLDRKRGKDGNEKFLQHLLSWERLERLPTRNGTGHFVAVHAARGGTPRGEE
jgi:SAM-dependent methyltransferase